MSRRNGITTPQHYFRAGLRIAFKIKTFLKALSVGINEKSKKKPAQPGFFYRVRVCSWHAISHHHFFPETMQAYLNDSILMRAGKTHQCDITIRVISPRTSGRVDRRPYGEVGMVLNQSHF